MPHPRSRQDINLRRSAALQGQTLSNLRMKLPEFRRRLQDRVAGANQGTQICQQGIKVCLDGLEQLCNGCHNPSRLCRS
jgi:hypothetical protein